MYWFSGGAFTEGIETARLDGQTVSIYNAEKSIADAFKYRNKIGLDVAVEALRNWREQRRESFETLLGYARVCRVDRVMLPYLEALA